MSVRIAHTAHNGMMSQPTHLYFYSCVGTHDVCLLQRGIPAYSTHTKFLFIGNSIESRLVLRLYRKPWRKVLQLARARRSPASLHPTNMCASAICATRQASCTSARSWQPPFWFWLWLSATFARCPPADVAPSGERFCNISYSSVVRVSQELKPKNLRNKISAFRWKTDHLQICSAICYAGVTFTFTQRPSYSTLSCLCPEDVQWHARNKVSRSRYSKVRQTHFCCCDLDLDLDPMTFGRVCVSVYHVNF